MAQSGLRTRDDLGRQVGLADGIKMPSDKPRECLCDLETGSRVKTGEWRAGQKSSHARDKVSQELTTE
jgi:hypothetical protein